jgi:hypothetical protein
VYFKHSSGLWQCDGSGMAANRVEFLANCGSRLDHSKGRNYLDKPKNARTINWDRVQGASNGKPRALSTRFLHKFKVFHPLTHHPDFPSSLSICPSLHALQIGKRRLSLPFHNFHFIITDSFMHEPFWSRRSLAQLPRSVYDLFMTLTH